MSELNTPHGKLVVYFHGAPGAPAEFQPFDLEAQKQGLTVFCPDRFAMDPAVTGEAYYQRLAEEITQKAGGQQVDVIGFSIGAFIALQTCRYLPNGVRSLHLVSAAAPLEAGNFLPAMAGQQVFRLAKAVPVLFLLLLAKLACLAGPPGLVSPVVCQRRGCGPSPGRRPCVSGQHHPGITFVFYGPRAGLCQRPWRLCATLERHAGQHRCAHPPLAR